MAIALDDSALIIGETAAVTFTFSEAPVGFTAGDVTVQNGTLSAFAATGNSRVFTATFTPASGVEDATNVISVGTGYIDAAGNSGIAGVSANYSIDTIDTIRGNLDAARSEWPDNIEVSYLQDESKQIRAMLGHQNM